MAEGGEPRTIAQVVGANMRRIRESRAKVLQDVSTAAKEVGLRWDASQVSRIETGKRDLTVEEFLALPLVMTLALDDQVTLVDLLEMHWGVGGTELYLRTFNRTTPVLPVLAMLAEPWIASAKPEYYAKVGEVFREYLEEDKRELQADRAPDPDRHTYQAWAAIAAEFGVSITELMDASKALWGDYTISLDQERERRLIESGVDISSPTSVRTQRGHITRQLMAELRDYFATHEAGASDD